MTRPLRIAVTGRDGQVARALRERDGAACTIVPVGRPEFDFEHPAGVVDALLRAEPDAIISAAAYTAVDRAESDEGAAMAVNAQGPALVGRAAAQLGVPVLHLSTDYVFAGDLGRPYREDDATGPTGVYGRSKLAGEAALADATGNHAILRTSWVYSPFGTNFVKTMLRLAETREAITVVADQQGCPTSAFDLADALVQLCRNLVARPGDDDLRGVFHMAGSGSATWADLAAAVFDEARARGQPWARVEPIPSSQYPTAARRPADSRLDCTKLRARHGVALPDWRRSVGHCVERLVSEGVKA